MDIQKGQLVLHGYHVWQENGKDVHEPISYPIDWPAIANGQSYPASVQVMGDRDFMLTHITHSQLDTGNIPLKVQIGTTNGMNLFRDPAWINAISSQIAGQPFVLAIKRLFRRTNSINLSFSAVAD